MNNLSEKSIIIDCDQSLGVKLALKKQHKE